MHAAARAAHATSTTATRESAGFFGARCGTRKIFASYRCALMTRVLLAHPLFLSKSPQEEQLASPYFPLGLLYLASYLREAGHTVTVFDGTFAEDEQAFARQLLADQPNIVGIAGIRPTRDVALLLARIAAEFGAVVTLGGPDPTADPEFYLRDPAVDIVVHHEGEQTLLQLAHLFDEDNLDLESMRSEAGIAFRADGRIIINEPRPPIEDLDDLPLPARDLIDMSRYLESWDESAGYSSITIATARGCPYGCTWCAESVHGDGFRQRSPESVAAEVAWLSKTYDVDRIRVIDDVEGIDRSWFESWADAADRTGTIVPFEPLNAIEISDLPMLDVQDSL